MEHTREPWGFLPSEGGVLCNEVVCIDGETIASVETPEDARRIIACVNSCAGISTDNLENNQPVQQLAVRYNAVIRQRDALKTMLEKLTNASAELVQYASYAEIVGGVSVNREQIREWCDKLFQLLREVDSVIDSEVA